MFTKQPISRTILDNVLFITRVGASQLSGGAVDIFSGGALTCIGVYDENYASPCYNTCP